jgi:hypothetical protein
MYNVHGIIILNLIVFQTSFKRREELDLGRLYTDAKRPRLETEVSSDSGERVAPGLSGQHKDPVEVVTNPPKLRLITAK